MKKLMFIFCLLIFSSFVQAADFDVNAIVIKSVVTQGDSVTYPINILNTGEDGQFSISFDSQVDFISTKNESFTVMGDSDAEVELILDSYSLDPGVYTALMTISNGKESIDVPVIFEIETEDVLFDATASLPPVYSLIKNGQQVTFSVKAYNVQTQKKDVTLHYKLLSDNGEVLWEDMQNLHIENQQVEVAKNVIMPKEGSEFIFAVEAIAEGSVGTATSLLTVSDKLEVNYLLTIAFSLVVILIAAFLVLNYFWNKRLKESAQNWSKNVKVIKKDRKINSLGRLKKLEYEKSLLDKAFRAKYITKESYHKGIETIDAEINKLRKKRL